MLCHNTQGLFWLFDFFLSLANLSITLKNQEVVNLNELRSTYFLLKFPGSLSDPSNISGLAHFCEHMLFLGTEKYPKENEYSQFLSEHAGSSNAFTSGEHTNYYFDVSHEHLEGALDR